MPDQGITQPYIEAYLDGLLPERDAILKRLEREAAEEGWPIIGPLVGRCLYVLAKLSNSRRALELGSAIGYSAIWLGRAVKANGGSVITVEINPDTAKRAERNFRAAGLEDTVKVIIGDALKTVSELKTKLDFVFIDAGKEAYPELFTQALDLLEPGGLLTADNCLWSGSVASGARDSSTAAISRFNKMAMESEKLEGVILPVRDGLYVGRKKG